MLNSRIGKRIEATDGILACAASFLAFRSLCNKLPGLVHYTITLSFPTNDEYGITCTMPNYTSFPTNTKNGITCALPFVELIHKEKEGKTHQTKTRYITAQCVNKEWQNPVGKGNIINSIIPSPFGSSVLHLQQ
ncbi:hypothetical protein RIF29_37848 [Crotalaria pallida]|uniref:Uncharacterized protein n=1 Tax=Crotalaria pallida TaxID=3830 RepID=A0AAN9DY11_CROPI